MDPCSIFFCSSVKPKFFTPTHGWVFGNRKKAIPVYILAHWRFIWTALTKQQGWAPHCFLPSVTMCHHCSRCVVAGLAWPSSCPCVFRALFYVFHMLFLHVPHAFYCMFHVLFLCVSCAFLRVLCAFLHLLRAFLRVPRASSACYMCFFCMFHTLFLCNTRAFLLKMQKVVDWLQWLTGSVDVSIELNAMINYVLSREVLLWRQTWSRHVQIVCARHEVGMYRSCVPCQTWSRHVQIMCAVPDMK